MDPRSLLPTRLRDAARGAASVGLFACLLAVVLVQGWSDLTDQALMTESRSARAVASAFNEAHTALTGQELLRHEALAHGVQPTDPARNAELERVVVDSLRWLVVREDADHARTLMDLLQQHGAYAAATRELLSVPHPAAGDTESMADAAVEQLMATLEAEAREHEEEAQAALVELEQHHAAGTTITLVVSGAALLLVLYFAAVLRAQRRELAQQAAAMRHASLHDGLTALGNRSLLGLHMDEALRRQGPGREVALLLIDLDRFKEINDTLGHHYGDMLLQQVGPRLRPLLREDDVLARLGGDEFAVLLPGLPDVATASAVAERLRNALAQDFEVGGVTLAVDASVGVATSSGVEQDPHVLMQQADIAMYAAKRGGSGGVRVYDPTLSGQTPDRLPLLGELRQAIEDGQMVLDFQPEVDLVTGRTTGMEALARWQHPTRGLLLPEQFIEMAESSGLMKPLTRYVLDRALEQCAAWRRDGHDVPVAVNLSGRNLLEDDLVQDVAALLARHGVPARSLVVEVTESAVVAGPDTARDVLTRLGTLGVGVALDDFGAGCASLAQLRHLPVDQLKIGRRFVSDLSVDPDDDMTIRTIVELGRSLGFGVVAGGVEDPDAASRLTTLGCDSAQGFLYAKPVPGPLVHEWLTDHSTPSASRRSA